MPVGYVGVALWGTGFPTFAKPGRDYMPKLQDLTAELPRAPGSILAVLGTVDDKNYAIDTLRKLTNSDGSFWKLTDQVEFERQSFPTIALYFFERQTGP